MDDRCQNRDKSVADSEYNFALSLVDDLKAIHSDYKTDAKMEILGILRKYKRMSYYSPNYSGYYSTPEPFRNTTSQPTMPSPSTSNDDNNIGYYSTPEPPQNMTSQITMPSPSACNDNSNTEDSIYTDLFTEN